ncbi:iron-containing alcohol dehydrogenase, partial [Selenomonas sp.]
MQNFTFKCPTDITFGRGAEEQVGKKIKEYGGTHVFIVYGGGSVVRSGLLARVERTLTEAGIAFTVRGGVQPNPLVSHAREGVREAIAFHADFILAVGGGSVIDTAKAIAHGVANPKTDIWDFWSGRAKLEASTPVAVVLTLAAAGSETSDSAVLTNEEMGIKGGINTPFNRPTLAFLNPELTYTVPQKQLVAGISDILMHTLERYFTDVKEP